MLSQAIGQILPTAIGVALSPVPIIAVILMLATPRARANGLSFALGWIVGLVVVTTIAVLLAGGSDDSSSTTADSVNWVLVGLGVLFLAMAMRQWRGRPQHGEAAVMPKWMSTIDTFTAGKSLGFGFLLAAINPKNLALSLAAGATIARAGLCGTDDAIAIAVFVVIGSLTVVGPVLFYVFASGAAAKPLASIKEFMAQHNAVIMMVVLLVLGAKMIGDGLPGI